MVMANETRLAVLLKGYDYSTTDEAYAEGLVEGDNKVKRYLNRNVPGFVMPEAPETLPDDFIDAATYWAASAIVTIITATFERTPAAVKTWKDEAKDCMDDFKATYEANNEETGSGTPIYISNIYDPVQKERDES